MGMISSGAWRAQTKKQYSIMQGITGVLFLFRGDSWDVRPVYCVQYIVNYVASVTRPLARAIL